MKVFSGFNEKERRANKIFACVFSFFFAISVYGALSTPSYSDLVSVRGGFVSIECQVKKTKHGTSQKIIIQIKNDRKLQQLSYSNRCRGESYSFKRDEPVEAKFKAIGGRIYELTIGSSKLISFKESHKFDIQLPLAAVFIFGLPWLIWASIRVAMA